MRARFSTGNTLLMAMLVFAPAAAARADAMLTDFPYPFEVKRFDFTSQKQPLTMAYMDVKPAGNANGDTIVLLHGKNFCAATWEMQIRPFIEAGYRVIAPDQIGFCKSSKPERYQFGFHQLAANTHALLQSLGIEKPILLGHSTGGMLAFRYALMFPQDVKVLAAVNPIGLEDWKAKGVPAVTIDALYETEKKTTAQSIRAYEQNTYYGGEWRQEYGQWADMLAGMYAGPDGDLFAWDQALTADMIFMQPVVYEFENIRVPTLLFIGEKDTTAMGKGRAAKEVAERIGNYKELGAAAARSIPGAGLVTFPACGHAPQVQAPGEFNAAFLANLAKFTVNAPALR